MLPIGAATDSYFRGVYPMSKPEHWGYKVVEVVAGLIVGLLIWLITDRKPETLVGPLTMGILVAIAVDVFRTRYWVAERFNEADSRVAGRFNEIDSRITGRFDEIDSRVRAIPVGLASSAQGTSLALTALALAGKEISVDNMPKVWTQLSWLMQKRYRATNLIAPVKIYTPKFAQAVMTIQEAKVVAQDVSVAKVFILEKKTELQEAPMPMIIEHHQKAGIIIKYIYLKELEEDEILKNKLAKLHSPDFAVFDDQVVFIWVLDNARHVTRCEVLVEPAECEKYSDFYSALEKEARKDF